MAISPSYGVPDKLLHFIVAAPPTNLSVWSVTISVVFLSEPKTILFIKAEFSESKHGV